MIEEFLIRNFKCFPEILLKPMKRVNLVTGKNNVGKTALLEAIWLHEGAHNAALSFAIGQFRGIGTFDTKEFLSDLFTNFAADKEIVLNAKYYDGSDLRLRIVQEENKQPTPILEDMETQGTASAVSPEIRFEGYKGADMVCKSSFFLAMDDKGALLPFSSKDDLIRPMAIFVSTGGSKESENRTNAERFSAQVSMKRKNEIIEALRLIEPRLQGLELTQRGKATLVCGDIGQDKLLPLSFMGEGMNRYLSFVLAILTAENGTVLIDEIENGLHYSILAPVWFHLATLAKRYNVQLVVTTHSFECIKAAYNAFEHDKDDNFVLHRLDRVGERIEDVTYDIGTLGSSFELNMEIR